MALTLHNEHGRRAELARFGYRTSEKDPATLWRTLRSDFPVAAAQVELDALAPDVRAKADAYCAHRAVMDELMDRCDAIHLTIVEGGPDAATVETYALARDEYEDSVERFGELRAEVQQALVASARGAG